MEIKGINMKTLLVMLGIFASGLSYASCPQHNYEGVFQNGVGEQFKVEQSNCSSILITEVQSGAQYPISLDGEFHKFNSGSIVTPFPLQYSAVRVSDRQVRVTFEAKPKADLSSYGGGPVTLQLDVDFYFNGDNSSTDSIVAYSGKLRAAIKTDDSPAKKIFVKGVNFGLAIASRLFGASSIFSDYLTRVN